DDTATATADNSATASDTASSTVTTSADLAVTKTGQTTITAGTTATYTITLTNYGPSDAANVELSDLLPTSLILLDESQASGTDSFTNHSTEDTAIFNATSVSAGNSDVFKVVVSSFSSLTDGSTVDDTATVTADNSATASDTASSTVTTAA